MGSYSIWNCLYRRWKSNQQIIVINWTFVTESHTTTEWNRHKTIRLIRYWKKAASGKGRRQCQGHDRLIFQSDFTRRFEAIFHTCTAFYCLFYHVRAQNIYPQNSRIIIFACSFFIRFCVECSVWLPASVSRPLFYGSRHMYDRVYSTCTPIQPVRFLAYHLMNNLSLIPFDLNELWGMVFSICFIFFFFSSFFFFSAFLSFHHIKIKCV